VRHPRLGPSGPDAGSPDTFASCIPDVNKFAASIAPTAAFNRLPQTALIVVATENVARSKQERPKRTQGK